MSEGEQFFYTLSPEEIKSEPESECELEVSCRICNKVFASCVALQNHARVAHIKAYEAGDPTAWTDDQVVSPKPSPKKAKPESKAFRTTPENVLFKVQGSDVTSGGSQNVSYIIIKNEEAPQDRKRKKKTKDKQEAKPKRAEPKEPEAITGPFECLEASTFGSDGTCHQMFFSCCEYSEHQLTEHTRPRRRTARCQVCERPLSQLHQTGPKDFTCEQCSEGFDTVNELMEHKNLFHLQKKRFQCTICSKRFSAQGGLIQHMRMHTGERPYSCTFCPKAFTQKSGLEQHTRIHTKVKPFRCVICAKTFIQTIHLKQHMRTHTNVAPFQCVVCEKRFKQSSHLNYHLKNHPADMTPEQKDKYRRIVEAMQREERADQETALAEQSISMGDHCVVISEETIQENGEAAPRVIACELTYDE